MTVEERFWSKVSPEPNSGCWLWTGALTSYGYAQLRINGRSRSVARLVLGLPFEGAWHLCACHRCDNPPCVNPAHLFVGTRAENQADMARKGRSGPRVRGEAHRSARLTEFDVRRIRAAVAIGISSRELAPLYGVSHVSISSAASGLTWSHVNADALGAENG